MTRLLFLLFAIIAAPTVRAAVAYVNIGAANAGTTSVAVPYHATVVAGNMLVLVVTNKYPAFAPDTPADWTFLAAARGEGGNGASGVDTGNVYSTVFYKVATGAETGSVTVTMGTVTGQIMQGRVLQFSKSLATWSLAASNGPQNSGGTASWSVTAAADPGLTAGDILVAASGVNTDAFTFDTHAVSATGISVWGTVDERADDNSAQGHDGRIVISTHPVTTGTSSAAPVHTMTASGSATNAPAGATVFFRLRETAAADVAQVIILSQILPRLDWRTLAHCHRLLRVE